MKRAGFAPALFATFVNVLPAFAYTPIRASRG